MKLFSKILFFIFIVLAGIIYWQYPRLNIISGFGAKNMCSCLFEANRDQAIITTSDNNFSPIAIAKYKIDRENLRVTASVFGMMKRTAVYHEDLGCQLILKGETEPVIDYFPVPHNCPESTAYPQGNEDQKDTILPNINYEKLEKAVSNAFDKEGVDSLKTRSVLVIHKDIIIAEKYASDFDKNSLILGWSMTKSVLATLFGILQKQGKTDLENMHLFQEWENSERSSISLGDLLQMKSGLEWEENYDKISDVTQMLFLDKDMTKKQLNKPLAYKIGEYFNYSSGTSNLLSGYLRNQFKTHQEYLDFPIKQLYDKLGMSSMLIETDLSGNYVASSYGWANTRDWAKLGLLYLHKGNWFGEQIIDESWVDYVSTPNGVSNGIYGAHFWLNTGGYRPDVPRDMFAMEGYQGQMVFIIPSKNLVVVRMGLTEEPVIDFNKMLKDIIATIE
ncbi:MAG TPA: class C beta-lactamase-related serine hydrolase [Lutibacter sp.]|nr:class C beta-lactamase-related serine hydrolase [Lutibacter sp.]